MLNIVRVPNLKWCDKPRHPVYLTCATTGKNLFELVTASLNDVLPMRNGSTPWPPLEPLIFPPDDLYRKNTWLRTMCCLQNEPVTVVTYSYIICVFHIVMLSFKCTQTSDWHLATITVYVPRTMYVSHLGHNCCDSFQNDLFPLPCLHKNNWIVTWCSFCQRYNTASWEGFNGRGIETDISTNLPLSRNRSRFLVCLCVVIHRKTRTNPERCSLLFWFSKPQLSCRALPLWHGHAHSRGVQLRPVCITFTYRILYY